MSLQIYIAHTGARLKTDGASFESLEALRSWIAQHAPVASSNQILMTEAGRPVKLQTLLVEKEIFVYDRLLISSTSATSMADGFDSPLPAPFSLKRPPDTLASPNDLGAWRNLFKARRSWAVELTRECSRMADAAGDRLEEMRIIDRAVAAAVTNLKIHVTGLKQKQTDATAWVRDIMAEQEPLILGWEEAVARLARIPVKDAIVQSRLFKGTSITGPESRKRGDSLSGRNATLWTLVDAGSAEHAAARARQMLDDLVSNESNVREAISKVVASSDDLDEKVKASEAQRDVNSEEELSRLTEDIEVIAKKVSSDYDQVLTFPESSKSLSQASKKAMIHTQDLLPSLADNAIGLDRLERRVTEERNATARSAARFLQTISTIEASLSNATQQLSTLDISPEAVATFDLLFRLTRLPYAYGSILIELLRRREWRDKVKKDSGALAEELALLKDEEERRRKKWQRSLGDIINTEATEERMVSVEVNMRGDERAWPVIERRDVEGYLSILKIDGMDGTVEELSSLVTELDRPKRQQSRHVRGFKHDSVHDVAMGRSSLLLRDDELVRSLRDDKAKLEEKLKGSESRIRKLEDIVHRQSDLNRNASGNIFQVPGGQRSDTRTTPPSTAHPFSASSRPQDALSRRSSVSSRRFSANQGHEEKALVQKILSLEADLTAEREQVAGLQKEASIRKEEEEAIRARIHEADSTKKDLMENMEAQQREFFDERKLLEEDSRRLRGRLEEIEDELDRMMGSREQEKAESDEKVRLLEVEVEEFRKKSSEEVERLRHELVTARTASQKNLERAAEAEKRVETATKEKASLEHGIQRLQEQLQRTMDDRVEQAQSLRSAHERLLPDEVAPAEFGQLVEAIESLVERSTNHLRDVEDALAMVRADNETLHDKLNRAEADYASMKEKVTTEEMESFSLRETLAGERGRLAALETEVAHERAELATLRAKFADGEVGSGALKERLAEEEANTVALRAELAAMQAEMTVFDQELRSRHDTMGAMNAASEALASQLRSRSDRAKDLSQRLYSFTDRVSRLLETLGFMVSYQNGEMTIQRIPKTMSASSQITTDPNSHALQDRTLSTSPQLTKRLGESMDLHWVHWMDTEDAEEESRLYSAYVEAVGKMDMDVVCEAIAKRMKDTEHVARKWQKEARSYRDRAHRFQSEAHEKIAYRSFREGDLALFLPTRNQATRPWAAFNVGAPHYFLREQETHKLRTRDWLLARITKVEERVVDLSRSMDQAPSSTAADGRSIGESSDGGASFDDENPFQLSDGLRWYLLDAAEEKPGAPSTPGLGKSTVASANVDAKGSVRVKKSAFSSGVTKTLHKSLDSRRSSGNKRESGSNTNLGGGTVGDVSSKRSSLIVVADPNSPLIGSRPSSQQQQQPPLDPSGVQSPAGQEQQTADMSLEANVASDVRRSNNVVRVEEAVYHDIDHVRDQTDDQNHQLLQQERGTLSSLSHPPPSSSPNYPSSRPAPARSTTIAAASISNSDPNIIHRPQPPRSALSSPAKSARQTSPTRYHQPHPLPPAYPRRLNTDHTIRPGIMEASSATDISPVKSASNALAPGLTTTIRETTAPNQHPNTQPNMNRPKNFWDSLWFLDLSVERGKGGGADGGGGPRRS